MESQSYNNVNLVRHTLHQMTEACVLLAEWNKHTLSVDDYATSSEGMQRLAASCMLVEAIGEGVKKIDRLQPGFLVGNAPEIPWRSLKGMRDHIAHGYFDIDADVVFDVVINEIPVIKICLERLITVLDKV